MGPKDTRHGEAREATYPATEGDHFNRFRRHDYARYRAGELRGWPLTLATREPKYRHLPD